MPLGQAHVWQNCSLEHSLLHSAEGLRRIQQEQAKYWEEVKNVVLNAGLQHLWGGPIAIEHRSAGLGYQWSHSHLSPYSVNGLGDPAPHSPTPQPHSPEPSMLTTVTHSWLLLNSPNHSLFLKLHHDKTSSNEIKLSGCFFFFLIWKWDLLWD